MRIFNIEVFVKIILIISLFAALTFAQAFQMAVVGDAGKSGHEMDALKESLLQAGQKVLIMPGDNLYKGSYESVWNSWKRDGFQFPIVAIGNHNDGYDQEVKYFGMPGEFYTKSSQGVRFFVLNSDNEDTVSEQFRWLENQFQKAQEKHIFLVYHHPTFTVTEGHHWKQKQRFQMKMRQFLKANGSRITALLLGHDHISTFVQFGPVVAMIAGSGRSARSTEPVHYVEDGFQIKTLYLAPESQHWGLLHFESVSDKIRAGFYSISRRKMTCVIELGKGRLRMAPGCQ